MGRMHRLVLMMGAVAAAVALWRLLGALPCSVARTVLTSTSCTLFLCLCSKGKGMSSSAIPYKRTPPSWCKTTAAEVCGCGCGGALQSSVGSMAQQGSRACRQPAQQEALHAAAAAAAPCHSRGRPVFLDALSTTL